MTKRQTQVTSVIAGLASWNRFHKQSIVVMSVFLATATVFACNVPVFRYALEHWQPDPYRVRITAGRSLTTEELQLVDELKTLSTSGQINLVVMVDANAEAANESNLTSEMPQMEVEFPASFEAHTVCWSTSLTANATKQLRSSPARREIVERLRMGQSAVWILVDGKDEATSDRTFSFVEEQLRRLQSTLELPELTDAPEDRIATGPELRVEFSLIRIRPGDETESFVVNNLLSSESDLRELQEPCLFPVFGRGRAFLPLVGAGISEENLLETASFVVGACSCQVKDQNPGFDLLIEADWKTLLPWAANAAGESDGMGMQRDDLQAASGEPKLLPISPGRIAVKSIAPSTAVSATAELPTAESANGTAAVESKPTRLNQPTGGIWLILVGTGIVLFTILVRFVRRD